MSDSETGTDDDSVPVRLTRLKRLTDKYERDGELTEEEVRQVHRDSQAVHEAIQEVTHSFVEAVVEYQESLLDAVRPLAEVAAEANGDDDSGGDGE